MQKAIFTMRKVAILTTALALAASIMVVSPVIAAAPNDGTYQCTSGTESSSTPNFTITGGVVTNGSSCIGAVVIPVGVTSIGESAFALATSLTSITIPAGVTSIGESAFEGATLLTSVYFLGNAPTISSGYAFFDIAAGAKAYVKSSATGFDTTGSPALWKGLVVEAYSLMERTYAQQGCHRLQAPVLQLLMALSL